MINDDYYLNDLNKSAKAKENFINLINNTPFIQHD